MNKRNLRTDKYAEITRQQAHTCARAQTPKWLQNFIRKTWPNGIFSVLSSFLGNRTNVCACLCEIRLCGPSPMDTGIVTLVEHFTCWSLRALLIRLFAGQKATAEIQRKWNNLFISRNVFRPHSTIPVTLRAVTNVELMLWALDSDTNTNHVCYILRKIYCPTKIDKCKWPGAKPFALKFKCTRAIDHNSRADNSTMAVDFVTWHYRYKSATVVKSDNRGVRQSYAITAGPVIRTFSNSPSRKGPALQLLASVELRQFYHDSTVDAHSICKRCWAAAWNSCDCNETDWPCDRKNSSTVQFLSNRLRCMGWKSMRVQSTFSTSKMRKTNKFCRSN